MESGEASRDSDERAGRADTRDPGVDALAELLGDLGARGFEVASGIDGVVELVGDEGAGVEAAISAARETAPAIISSAGVRTTCAPAAAISFALTAP